MDSDSEFSLSSTIRQGCYILSQLHEWLCSTIIPWLSKPVHLTKIYHCQQSHSGTWKNLCYATRCNWNTPYHLQNTFQPKWLCNTLLQLKSMTLVQFMWAKKTTKLAQNYFNENYSQSMFKCQPCLKSSHRKITIEHYKYMYLRQQLTKIVIIKIIKNKTTFFWMLVQNNQVLKLNYVLYKAFNVWKKYNRKDTPSDYLEPSSLQLNIHYNMLHVCIWCPFLFQISLAFLCFCHITIISLFCVESPGPWFHFTSGKSMWFTDLNKWLFFKALSNRWFSYLLWQPKLPLVSKRQSRRNVYLPSSTWPWISCC